MVKCFIAVVFVTLFALPALAQDDDFPRIEISLGYGNVATSTLDDFLTTNLGVPFSGRHSGFASAQGFNFTRWLGLENYLGYYGLGNRTEMFTNVFGAKAAYRNLPKIVPYAVAGIGGSSVSIGGYSFQGGSGFATRLGGGFDYKLNDGMSIRFDFSRLSHHLFDE